MKRSTHRWTTAIAAAALLAFPATGLAQSPQQPTPSSPGPAGGQGSTGAHQHGTHMQQGAPNQHLGLAEAALNDISAESLPGAAKSRVTELKQHVNKLKSASAHATGQTTTGTTAQHQATADWKSEVASIERILNELIGADTATNAAGATTGTSGAGTASAVVTLDDTTRGKLREVRKHVIKVAAQMTGSTSGQDASASSTAAQGAQSLSSASSSSATSAGASTTPAGTSATSSTQSAEPQTRTAETQDLQGTPDRADQQVDVDAQQVKAHLTAARDSLSQLTQLPAAAQLSGEARTHVSQLISSFNELITTNTEWRASYAKVQSSLGALLGDQRADESQAPTAGAAGAVGTSGAVTIDPAIREKLVEFRTHLMAFEQAAGGASGSTSTPASPSTSPSASATDPAQTSPATASSTQPSEPATAPSSPTATTGAATATPGATGTSGRNASAEPAGPAATSEEAAHADAMRHIQAIEAILNSGNRSTSTAGGSAALDQSDVEQIRKHVAELRKGLRESRK